MKELFGPDRDRLHKEEIKKIRQKWANAIVMYQSKHGGLSRNQKRRVLVAMMKDIERVEKKYHG